MKTLLIIIFSIGLFAKEPKPFSTSKYFIEGYDPVTYISDNKATKGSKKFSLKHKGIDVLFSSEENLKLFKANPEKYWPQYNGYCAYALAIDNGLVEVNPKTFKVINGKTYLFYNDAPGFFSTNTLEKWNEEKDDKQIELANSFYAEILKD